MRPLLETCFGSPFSMRPRFFATLIDAPAALSASASKVIKCQALTAVTCRVFRTALPTSWSESTDVETAIDGYVLPGQIAGMDRAEKGADLAEFLRRAEPFGRHVGTDAGLARRGRLGILWRASLMRAAQSVGVELAGQETVDGHVALDHRARHTGEKRGQSGARAR